MTNDKSVAALSDVLLLIFITKAEASVTCPPKHWRYIKENWYLAFLLVRVKFEPETSVSNLPIG